MGHQCIRYTAVMFALGVAYTAWGQGPPVPPGLSDDPTMQLVMWAISNYGLTGGIMAVAGYLLGKKGGIPVRLSDEDRELLKK